MKRILIVDDNATKLENLAQSAERLFPEAKVETHDCQTTFLRAIRNEYWEEVLRKPEEYLLIIDMQMPMFWHGPIDVEGGYDTLVWLSQSGVQCPAIIASSEVIDEDRAKESYDNYRGFVHYSAWCSPTSAMKEVLAEYLPAE